MYILDALQAAIAGLVLAAAVKLAGVALLANVLAFGIAHPLRRTPGVRMVYDAASHSG